MRNFLNYSILLVLMVNTNPLWAQHDAASKAYKTIDVAKGVYMLQGEGGNIGVNLGEDGVLLVDDGYEHTTPALDKALQTLGGAKPRFVLNTHWHGDHTGGNRITGQHAHIIAHDNVRKRLSTRQEVKEFNMVSEPQEKVALPIITFDASLSVHFNGQEIKALHLPAGHTDGDSVVFFSAVNVVHMGDLYFQGMFPFIDLSSGGNVRSFVANVGQVLTQIDDKTKVIPGHGNLSNKAELHVYHQMLQESIAEVEKMQQQGLTVEQAKSHGLPPRFAKWGKGFIKAEAWIEKLYAGL